MFGRNASRQIPERLGSDGDQAHHSVPSVVNLPSCFSRIGDFCAEQTRAVDVEKEIEARRVARVFSCPNVGQVHETPRSIFSRREYLTP